MISKTEEALKNEGFEFPRAHMIMPEVCDVRLSSVFPTGLMTNERQGVSVTISSSNSNPEVVWDEVYITVSEDVTPHYVEGLAKIYNSGKVNGSIFSTKMFSGEGTLLGIDELNGVITCDNESCSGQIVYIIQVSTVGIQGETPNIGNFWMIAIMVLVLLVVIFVVVISQIRIKNRR